MAKVNFIQPDGVSKEVDVPAGRSLMEVAVQNDVMGIDAECGGACMCATCHVYVDEAYVAKLTDADELEGEMLDSTSSERKPNSRLCCQINMLEELDGIIIEIPPTQS